MDSIFLPNSNNINRNVIINQLVVKSRADKKSAEASALNQGIGRDKI